MMAPLQPRQAVFVFFQVFLFGSFCKASTNITLFTLETQGVNNEIWKRDLFNKTAMILIQPMEVTMNVTCSAIGDPEPEVEISRGVVLLKTSKGSVSYVINHIRCQNSGVYTCQARNRFTSAQVQKKIEVTRSTKIESFAIKQVYSGFSYRSGKIEMRCAVTNCPGPSVLKVVNDVNQTIASVYQISSLVHEVRKVQCSDMGTFFCRAETKDGQIMEESADLRVDRCPVQLCRGEDRSKVISATIGQTVNFSFCVISQEEMWWMDDYLYENVSVTITNREPSSLYFSVDVVFYNIQEHDHGTKIIKLFSPFGNLNYNVTINVENTPTNITLFTLETEGENTETETWNRDLLKEKILVLIQPIEITMNITCSAIGHPEPEVEISRDGVLLKTSKGRVSHVINHVRCQDSGVYVCQARNRFTSAQVQKKIEVTRPTKIESFGIKYGYSGFIYSGGKIEMRCAVTSCPGPSFLTIMNDVNQTITSVYQNGSLINEVREVQCSDIGTYFCRAETKDGQILEETADLRVDGCPVHLCRGEDRSKVISATIGQTVNFSFCIISQEETSWWDKYLYKNVSVTVRNREPSSLYFSVDVVFYNIQEHDHGTKIIKLFSPFGNLNYNVTIDVENTPTNITLFTLETEGVYKETETWNRDLVNETNIVLIQQTEIAMNITCSAIGRPEPEVGISRDGVLLKTSKGRVSHVINHVGCQDSGIYTCQARNRFTSVQVQKKIEVTRPTKIESFGIKYGYSGFIYSGGKIEMRCAVTSCPGPSVLTIMNDVNQTITSVYQNGSLINEVRKVQCSDIGTYFCRAETKDGQILEETADLRVDGCPVQLCRGEDRSKVISATIGQTVNFSFCIISQEETSWWDKYLYKNVSVTITNREPSSLYFSVDVVFYNIQEHDHGTKIIKLFSPFGNLNYNVTIDVENTPTNITLFTLETEGVYKETETWNRDLLNETNIVLIQPMEVTMNITCSAIGRPEPEVGISRDGVLLKISKGRVSHVINHVRCQDSGVYVCHAGNRFTSSLVQKKIEVTRLTKIESFTVTGYGGYMPRGGNKQMKCTVTNCPGPSVLTIVNDVNQTIATVFQNSSLVHEVRNVRCPDMGTFFCRAETKDGQILEETADLRVDGCPAQLCRGENTSKVISTAIGQTVKFSICIISQGNPRWLDTSLYEDLSVTFTVMEPNGLYFSVNILLYNVQEHDQGTKVFSIDNGNGLLHYKVTLNIENPDQSENVKFDTSLEGNNYYLYIVVPSVFVIALIIGLFLLRCKERLLKIFRVSVLIRGNGGNVTGIELPSLTE